MRGPSPLLSALYGSSGAGSTRSMALASNPAPRAAPGSFEDALSIRSMTLCLVVSTKGMNMSALAGRTTA